VREGEGEDMSFSNELNDDELERLAILSEELGEAQQAIGKILRHGYDSYSPLRVTETNRGDLERELGHVQFAIKMLCDFDIASSEIRRSKSKKAKTIQSWLHHNKKKDVCK
jgi:NTP pyrophosphatase (non-canonical NTP hydrolase)